MHAACVARMATSERTLALATLPRALGRTPPPGRTLTDLDAPAPPWHAPIVNPKLRAALVAGAIAGIAAGSRACVIAIADVDADVHADVAANVARPPLPRVSVSTALSADAGAE